MTVCVHGEDPCIVYACGILREMANCVPRRIACTWRSIKTWMGEMQITVGETQVKPY